MDMLEHARRIVASGVSVVSIRVDGSKAADRPWKPFQKKKATGQELERMFNGRPCGIAAIGGVVSGGLEIIDMESCAPAARFFERLQEELGREFASRLVLVRTPTGGIHVYSRCPGHIEGSLKLAWKEEGEIMIETRGEGAYVLTVGCPPQCHPAGKPYTLLQGDITQIPTISADERTIMFDFSPELDGVGGARGAGIHTSSPDCRGSW